MLIVGELYIVFATKIFNPASVAVCLYIFLHCAQIKFHSLLETNDVIRLAFSLFSRTKTDLQKTVLPVKFSPQIAQKSAAGSEKLTTCPCNGT